MTKKTLQVLILSDGRAGHLHRSEGVAQALARKIDISVDVLNLPTPSLLPKASFHRLAKLMPASSFLQIFHGLNYKTIQRPDLIVSAGGVTLGANVALTKLLNLPNIYIGKLRGMPKGAVSISMPPYRVRGEVVENNIPWCPVKIDPDELPEVRKIGDVNSSMGFLIGGATKDIKFDRSDWQAITKLILDFANKSGSAIKVATSPRTPDAAYEEFAALENHSQINYIDFRKAGLGSAKVIFECDAILATLDSSSMITEALASRRPVMVIAPKKVAKSVDEEMLDIMMKENRLVVINAPYLEAKDYVSKLNSMVPAKENHLDILADTILRDLPELAL